MVTTLTITSPWLNWDTGLFVAAVVSAGVAYRGYRMKQLHCFAREFERNAYHARLLNASNNARLFVIAVDTKSKSGQRFQYWPNRENWKDCPNCEGCEDHERREDHEVYPACKGRESRAVLPAREAQGILREYGRGRTWELTWDEMLGLGHTLGVYRGVDRGVYRADMDNFLALAMRITYWLGSGWHWFKDMRENTWFSSPEHSRLCEPRLGCMTAFIDWLKKRRARHVLGVFGYQLTEAIHYHRFVASRIVRVVSKDEKDEAQQTWDYFTYPDSYNLFDESYTALFEYLLGATPATRKNSGPLAKAHLFEEIVKESTEESVKEQRWPTIAVLKLSLREAPEPQGERTVVNASGTIASPSTPEL